MSVTKKDISDLRNSTGAGIMDCKKALEESDGNIEKAIENLRKKGAATSAKRADRKVKEGVIAVYSHGGRIAAMAEVNCETDFVARNDDFKEFAREVAMHIAASNPSYISKENIPAEVLKKEKEIELAKIKDSGKPKEVVEKIIEGKLEKYYEQVCLLSQPYIKNPDIKVEGLLNEQVVKIGEKIEIRRFERYEVGK